MKKEDLKKLKSVVLLSGGLDSAVNLYEAHREGNVVLALTFFYGQRAAEKEMGAARQLCQNLNLPHRVIDISWIKSFGGSSLIDEQQAVPQGTSVQIDSLERSLETAKSVWVPNRNGIFLNIAAGFAESLGAELVIPGFNLEEGQTFPDNTQGFLEALTTSFSYSTANKVKAYCYTTGLDKSAIVKRALTLNLPLNHLWSCYFAGDQWCGECESCLRFKRALEANHQSFQEWLR